MKINDLDTKEVTLYVLNEKVFDLEECPDWAQYAAVDEDGTAYFYMCPPSLSVRGYRCTDALSCCIQIGMGYSIFDPTDWQHSLIERPDKCTEQ